MKHIFILFVILTPAICFSQALPVKMIIRSEQVEDQSYILLVNVEINDGWHVYAKTDTSLGIDPMTIMLGNNNLELSDEKDFKTTDVVDSLFGNKIFSVYRNENVFQKVIKVPEESKFIVVSVAGFASNQRQVVPIKICRLVDLNNGIFHK